MIASASNFDDACLSYARDDLHTALLAADPKPPPPPAISQRVCFACLGGEEGFQGLANTGPVG